MDKKTVGSILKETSILLDLKGENPFKSRAYMNAARIIESLEMDLEQAVHEGKLDKVNLIWDSRPCICVVIASGGYPQDYQKGKQIFGLSEAAKISDTIVFHAGTKKEAENYFTSGGRVLNVVALGDDLKQAQTKVYQAVEKINFDKIHFRKDIGWRALKDNKS